MSDDKPNVRTTFTATLKGVLYSYENGSGYDSDLGDPTVKSYNNTVNRKIATYLANASPTNPDYVIRKLRKKLRSTVIDDAEKKLTRGYKFEYDPTVNIVFKAIEVYQDDVWTLIGHNQDMDDYDII
jgi:hypothetical protein